MRKECSTVKIEVRESLGLCDVRKECGLNAMANGKEGKARGEMEARGFEEVEACASILENNQSQWTRSISLTPLLPQM